MRHSFYPSFLWCGSRLYLKTTGMWYEHQGHYKHRVVGSDDSSENQCSLYVRGWADIFLALLLNHGMHAALYGFPTSAVQCNELLGAPQQH